MKMNENKIKIRKKSPKIILKLTLQEYGYKLSDYIFPVYGLEMAIIEAMERFKDDGKYSQNLNVKINCYKCNGNGCNKCK